MGWEPLVGAEEGKVSAVWMGLACFFLRPLLALFFLLAPSGWEGVEEESAVEDSRRMDGVGGRLGSKGVGLARNQSVIFLGILLLAVNVILPPGLAAGGVHALEKVSTLLTAKEAVGVAGFDVFTS